MASALILDIGRREGDLFARGYSLLGEAERDRLSCFRNPEDALRMTCGRLLLRWHLASLIGPEDASAAGLDYSHHGRPSLRGYPDLDFNLSHSGPWVACAVSRRGRIGIDVETARDPSGQVADRFFSVHEKAWLGSMLADQVEERFTQLWTLKEALVKADGRGLSIPLDSFTLRMEAGGAPRLEPGDWASPDNWSFASRRLGPGACLGVAYPWGERLELLRVTAETLLQPGEIFAKEIGTHA